MVCKKLLLICIVLLVSTATTNAQTLTANQISSHIRQILVNNYKPDTSKLLLCCKQALVNIKFKVNKQGKIANIAFSNDSVKFVNEALKKAIKTLEGDKYLIKILKRTGKIIVQPFLYDYRHGCSIPTLQKDTLLNYEARVYTAKIIKIFTTRDLVQQTLVDMLAFNRNDNLAVDCILLKPIVDYFIDLPY
ncbi:hypothetical protein [Mucilaginibacter sp. 44-25]|uniref:hypothetical protein n=1 Tax=Mucilaginibacter sp. 44-25 TaxID=1895794 RepID=UPI00095BAF9C|nr:hypothetical protein [Mucilaginibacter sp. 44-25]OJW17643.1 MAG: hypothetical protein BGO48_08930 [Mucilaginibacter sp. 44-25]